MDLGVKKIGIGNNGNKVKQTTSIILLFLELKMHKLRFNRQM